LTSDDFEIDQVNWSSMHNPNEAIEVTVKIRYSHPGTSATLTPLENGRARVQLHEAQKAVTPGQAAVFYDGDIVVGGGWICRANALQLA
jgi:tRNA-specific 2-thiouridylase